MSRLLGIWRAWSLQQRAALIGGIIVVIAGVGIGVYLHFKRPGDIHNDDVAFHEAPKEKPKPKPAQTVNWPVYGLNPQRTRYLPADNIKKPFRELWRRESKQLLEFSPIVVGDRLYYIDKSADFYAVNAKDGKTIWRTDLGSLNASAPAYSKGRLFGVSLDPGQVFALDPKKGKVIWKHALPGRSETSPVVDGNDVIVGSESGDVFGLKKKNGDVDWSIHTDGAVKGGVAVDKGVAFFGNYAGQFYAVDAKTGHVKWTAESEGLSFGRAGELLLHTRRGVRPRVRGQQGQPRLQLLREDGSGRLDALHRRRDLPRARRRRHAGDAAHGLHRVPRPPFLRA